VEDGVMAENNPTVDDCTTVFRRVTVEVTFYRINKEGHSTLWKRKWTGLDLIPDLPKTHFFAKSIKESPDIKIKSVESHIWPEGLQEDWKEIHCFPMSTQYMV